MVRKLSFLGAFIILSLLAASEPRAEESFHVEQAMVTIPKDVLIEQNMRLDDKESVPFWNVYGDYQIALDVVTQKLEALLDAYTKSYRTITDEEADAMLQSYFAIEKEKIAVREQFIPKFKAVLSARQVARLYQIENKFDAIVKFGLVEKVPLVPTKKA